jgi:hypothetical protein
MRNSSANPGGNTAIVFISLAFGLVYGGTLTL